jgi:hypothetical protein
MNLDRVAPPQHSTSSVTVNGRVYSTVDGRIHTDAGRDTIDVPEIDSKILAQNGWTIVANGVGSFPDLVATPTAVPGLKPSLTNRPANPSNGQGFHDAYTNTDLVYDSNGQVWRNKATGAVVPDIAARVPSNAPYADVAAAGKLPATRPTNPTDGQSFYDADLGITIAWDASARVWRNSAGTAV